MPTASKELAWINGGKLVNRVAFAILTYRAVHRIADNIHLADRVPTDQGGLVQSGQSEADLL
jgi:hypothetical protein